MIGGAVAEKLNLTGKFHPRIGHEGPEGE